MPDDPAAPGGPRLFANGLDQEVHQQEHLGRQRLATGVDRVQARLEAPVLRHHLDRRTRVQRHADQERGLKNDALVLKRGLAAGLPAVAAHARADLDGRPAPAGLRLAMSHRCTAARRQTRHAARGRPADSAHPACAGTAVSRTGSAASRRVCGAPWSSRASGRCARPGHGLRRPDFMGLTIGHSTSATAPTPGSRPPPWPRAWASRWSMPVA